MMDIRKIRCTVPCQVEKAESGCHCAEARAEIERLRAALRGAEGQMTMGNMNSGWLIIRAALEGK